MEKVMNAMHARGFYLNLRFERLKKKKNAINTRKRL
jgi:hypothetical protein